MNRPSSTPARWREDGVEWDDPHIPTLSDLADDEKWARDAARRGVEYPDVDTLVEQLRAAQAGGNR